MWQRSDASSTTPESPRVRRLRNDLAAMEQLREESSLFSFKAHGKPAQHYEIEFRGRSLARLRGKVGVTERHVVEIRLPSSYPRGMPELRWVTPIYHPNISEIGMVCLGGYGTHWVPSLNLDELVAMLWDMARYHNYDVRSPYNRDAALWVAHQTAFAFPIDTRPIRDLRAALGRIENPAPFARLADPLLDGQATSASPEPSHDLFVIDATPETPVMTPSPPPVDQPVRLRSRDEDIVFIE